MHGKVDRKDFENYLSEARTWETDKVAQAEQSKKIAWYVAAAGIVAGIFGTASATLQAMHDPAPPVVLRVDNSTGIVDLVNTLTNGKTNYEEAVNKYFTQWYVRYREGFTSELTEEYYYNVGIMSAGLEQQKYFEYFNPKNPLSPINVYGPYAKVKVRIKSTSFIKPNVALVRYTKAIERGLDKPQVTHWASTITFKYSGAPMKEIDRGINPLGFQVVEYRNDPDALAPEASAPTGPDTSAASVSASAGVTVFAGQRPSSPAAQTPAIQSIQSIH